MTIKGLPQKISTEGLLEFDFGADTSARDDLILDELCFCEIAPVNIFLEGNKDYLVGVKGSGKSTVFRCLSERKIHFRNDLRLKQHILVIDDDIQYLNARERIYTGIESTIKDEDLRFRFVWEIFVIYRVALFITRKYEDVPKQLSKKLQNVIAIFDTNREARFIDVLTAVKFGASFSFSDFSGMPTAEIFVQPGDTNKSKASEDSTACPRIDVSDYVEEIHNFLKSREAVVYLLIDNLDEFLSREKYDAQRLVVQGLLACIKNYRPHCRIKVKASLRNEVFHKADFAKMGGAEKIIPNAVYLEWSAADIRSFIGRRFLYNFLKIYNPNSEVTFEYEEEDLYIYSKRPRFIPARVWKLLRSLKGSHDAVDIPERDLLWSQIMTLLLPREILHYNQSGQKVGGMSVFEYIDSHFSLANSKVTPRAIVIYLRKLLDTSKSYYRRRNFPNIELNSDGEYPLFCKDHLLGAYGDLQTEMLQYISSAVTHPEWVARIDSLLTSIGRRTRVSFRDLRRILDYEDSDTDAKELMAFLEHLGVLKCDNKSVHLPDRSYELPVLLQKNWVEVNG